MCRLRVEGRTQPAGHMTHRASPWSSVPSEQWRLCNSRRLDEGCRSGQGQRAAASWWLLQEGGQQ